MDLTLEQQIARMTEDERRVTEMFVEKLMGEGRKEYGPLDLSYDPRTIDELMTECIDEGIDQIAYLLFVALKLSRLGKN